MSDPFFRVFTVWFVRLRGFKFVLVRDSRVNRRPRQRNFRPRFQIRPVPQICSRELQILQLDWLAKTLLQRLVFVAGFRILAYVIISTWPASTIKVPRFARAITLTTSLIKFYFETLRCCPHFRVISRSFYAFYSKDNISLPACMENNWKTAKHHRHFLNIVVIRYIFFSVSVITVNIPGGFVSHIRYAADIETDVFCEYIVLVLQIFPYYFALVRSTKNIPDIPVFKC